MKVAPYLGDPLRIKFIRYDMNVSPEDNEEEVNHYFDLIDQKGFEVVDVKFSSSISMDGIVKPDKSGKHDYNNYEEAAYTVILYRKS
jgi:hypothetical protein